MVQHPDGPGAPRTGIAHADTPDTATPWHARATQGRQRWERFHSGTAPAGPRETANGHAVCRTLRVGRFSTRAPRQTGCRNPASIGNIRAVLFVKNVRDLPYLLNSKASRGARATVGVNATCVVPSRHGFFNRTATRPSSNCVNRSSGRGDEKWRRTRRATQGHRHFKSGHCRSRYPVSGPSRNVPIETRRACSWVDSCRRFGPAERNSAVTIEPKRHHRQTD